MPALLLDVAVRAVLIAAGTALILWALRIRPAAARHAAWTTVLVAMLVLPLWALAGPRLSIPVLPAPGAPTPATVRNPNLVVPPMGATWGIPFSADAGSSASSRTTGVIWVLGSVYVLGVVALLTRLAIGTLQARRLRRAAVVHAGRPTSARCSTPITVGWFAPVLILPQGWDRWSAAQLDAVLTHEGAHARRRDPLVQWLALLNRAIFWFHPLAWWLERRLASLAEEACDAAVIRAGHSPQDYCDYLIDMARTLRRQGRRLNVIGMAMPGSGLPERLKHIFEEIPMQPLSRAKTILTVTFCAASSIAVAAAALSPRIEAAAASASTLADTGGREVGLQEASTKKKPAASTPPKLVSVKPPPVVMAKEVKPPHVMMFVPRVDLSGEWVQVGSEYKGAGRGSAGGRGDGRMISISSGAPVNCGTTCTIVQEGSTMTLTRPDQPGVTPPDAGTVVLHTDGNESSIKQSATSDAQFKATAKWQGDKLVVTRDVIGSLSVTQTLSIVGGKLHVVTQFSKQDSPVTMIYEKR